jgi:hypothetical protein
MKRKDIEKAIDAFSDLINSIIYPYGVENQLCEEADMIYRYGLELIDNANRFSRFNTKKISGELGRELAFLTKGSCALGVITAQTIIDRDENKYQEFIQNSIYEILNPTIKITNRLIDLCNNGNSLPFSPYDPKEDFYKRFLENSLKLVSKANLKVIENSRRNS